MKLAQNVNIAPKGGTDSIARIKDFEIGDVLSTAVTLLLIVAGLIFFFMLVIGGIKWIVSGGDKAKTEGARNQITAALIGLVIVFSAWAIATLLGTVFGFNILEFTIPSIGNVVTI